MPPRSIFKVCTTNSTTIEVRNIISEHISALMQGSSYNPKSVKQLYDFMIAECSNILTERLINGTYTPMEYNAIRNELASTLWNIFRNDIENDRLKNLPDKI